MPPDQVMPLKATYGDDFQECLASLGVEGGALIA